VSSDLKLGFIPLNDCAPLAVADAQGFFRAEGLSVTLSREASWATIRDKVAVGALDGGHMLAPMVLAAGLGLGGAGARLIAPLAMNLNGSAITLAAAHAAELRRLDPEGAAARTARPLARLIEARRGQGAPLLTFAAVFPYSMHNYALRYWLAEAGIDPDRDVRLVTAPPPRMAEQLRSGLIDGFCVGAPWNAQAEADGTGEIVAWAADVWQAGPDKVLGVAEDWAEREPATLQALLRALLRAAQWSDAPENRPALAALLARPDYVGAPSEVIARTLTDAPEGLIYHRYAANFPWRSHASWFYAQMLRWGQIAPSVEGSVTARRVYRPDLYRVAATSLGVQPPPQDDKIEGAHADPWSLDGLPMPADRFCDGRPFDPSEPELYAAGFAITRA
jgi:ABC-type nitrate/sulfonate/bicarbonate transport system substrate-binding protein